MFFRLFKAGMTATAVTAAAVAGKGYQQTVLSEAVGPGDDSYDIERTKDAARELVLRVKEECGAPGVTIAVSRNGRPIWAEGFGYADVENLTAMTPRHVLRIASISKPMTMALVGRAVDSGLLDVSASVHRYLPHYPRHAVDGEMVEMTIDQIATHRAGIRHYHKKPDVHVMKKNEENSKKNKLAHEILSEQGNKQRSDSLNNGSNTPGSGDRVGEKSAKEAANTVAKQEKTDTEPEKSKQAAKSTKPELAKEFHTAVKYANVGEALNVFKDDELIHKPGEDFHYSTHGYTLLSAVLEAATGARFADQLRDMFHALDLRHTHLDENEPIIRHRARYYVHGPSGRLQNAPHVDNSWKIAGGGLLSTPSDLCRFADTMLYSWQAGGEGYLRPETARWLWSAPEPPPGRRRWSPYRYARGWQVRPARRALGAGPGPALLVCHTGGAAGCSSVLLTRPEGERSGEDGRPRGVTVAVIVNCEGADLRQLADDVARLFAD